MTFIAQLLTLLKNICFPPRCAHCDTLGTFLCKHCYNQIEFFVTPPTIELNHVASLTVCGNYDSPLGSLIKELKYLAITDQARTIAQTVWYSCDLPQIAALSYIPMHPTKQKKREFNQTELVAKELAKLLDLPVVQFVDKKIPTTALALSHSKAQRLEIIGNSFALKKPPLLNPYQSILLIDDVITTGTTLNTIAALLHTHYPELSIHCLAIAHRS